LSRRGDLSGLIESLPCDPLIYVSILRFRGTIVKRKNIPVLLRAVSRRRLRIMIAVCGAISKFRMDDACNKKTDAGWRQLCRIILNFYGTFNWVLLVVLLFAADPHLPPAERPVLLTAGERQRTQPGARRGEAHSGGRNNL